MAKQNGLHAGRETAPEEHGAGPAVARGSQAPFDSGFGEGEHGRGPSPYSIAHSGKARGGHSLEAHTGTSGRGGPGVIGKGDGFKSRSEDVEHPQSHSEFEALGTQSE